METPKKKPENSISRAGQEQPTSNSERIGKPVSPQAPKLNNKGDEIWNKMFNFPSKAMAIRSGLYGVALIGAIGFTMWAVLADHSKPLNIQEYFGMSDEKARDAFGQTDAEYRESVNEYTKRRLARQAAAEEAARQAEQQAQAPQQEQVEQADAASAPRSGSGSGKAAPKSTSGNGNSQSSTGSTSTGQSTQANASTSGFQAVKLETVNIANILEPIGVEVTRRRQLVQSHVVKTTDVPNSFHQKFDNLVAQGITANGLNATFSHESLMDQSAQKLVNAGYRQDMVQATINGHEAQLDSYFTRYVAQGGNSPEYFASFDRKGGYTLLTQVSHTASGNDLKPHYSSVLVIGNKVVSASDTRRAPAATQQHRARPNQTRRPSI